MQILLHPAGPWPLAYCDQINFYNVNNCRQSLRVRCWNLNLLQIRNRVSTGWWNYDYKFSGGPFTFQLIHTLIFFLCKKNYDVFGRASITSFLYWSQIIYLVIHSFISWVGPKIWGDVSVPRKLLLPVASQSSCRLWIRFPPRIIFSWIDVCYEYVFKVKK